MVSLLRESPLGGVAGVLGFLIQTTEDTEYTEREKPELRKLFTPPMNGAPNKSISVSSVSSVVTTCFFKIEGARPKKRGSCEPLKVERLNH
jgi:hypothetical protein